MLQSSIDMTDGLLVSAAPALALVLALVWLAGHAARRGWLRFPRSSPQATRMGVVETIAIDTRRRLHLIRCDDRQVVLLTGGTQDMIVLRLNCRRENNS